MQNKINEKLGDDVKKILDIKTLLTLRLDEDNLLGKVDIELLHSCLDSIVMDYNMLERYDAQYSTRYYGGQSKTLNNCEIIERFYNASFDLYKLVSRMEHFTDDIAKALDLTIGDIKTASRYFQGNLCLFIEGLDLYITLSTQHIAGWKDLFHITKIQTDIHNIKPEHSLGVSRSQGTGSYSFTLDDILLGRIINEVKCGRFVCKTKSRNNTFTNSISDICAIEKVFPKLKRNAEELVEGSLKYCVSERIQKAMNTSNQEKIIKSAVYKVGDNEILFENGQYTIKGLKLKATSDFCENKEFLANILEALDKGDAEIISLVKL
jgi:hypothetical protein